MKEVMPAYVGYEKVNIWAANSKQFAANYKGCCKWAVELSKKGDKAVGATVMQNNSSFFGGMPEWLVKHMFFNNQNNNQVPAGYVHEGVVQAQIEMLKQQMNYNTELAKIQKANEDPVLKYAPLAEKFTPALMYMMGKPAGDIATMMSLMGTSNMKGAPQIGSTTKLSFEDVSKLSSEEKNNKIEELMNKIAADQKVSAEQMILLLNAIVENPALVDLALNFLASKK